VLRRAAAERDQRIDVEDGGLRRARGGRLDDAVRAGLGRLQPVIGLDDAVEALGAAAVAVGVGLFGGVAEGAAQLTAVEERADAQHLTRGLQRNRGLRRHLTRRIGARRSTQG
jgi:hypothetical protein